MFGHDLDDQLSNDHDIGARDLTEVDPRECIVSSGLRSPRIVDFPRLGIPTVGSLHTSILLNPFYQMFHFLVLGITLGKLLFPFRVL